MRFSEEELRSLGPNVRRLVEHFVADHEPSDEEKRAMGSRLRGIGHILLRAGRRVEDGDVDAIGEMIMNPEVKWLVKRYLETRVLSDLLLNEAEKADAENN